MVSCGVFCEDNEVVSAHVFLAFHVVLGVARHVHLAAEYRFEGKHGFLLADVIFELFAFTAGGVCEFILTFCELVFGFAFYFVHVVEKLLYSHHVSVVGYGHAAHAVLYGFVNEPRNACLAVENGILGVNVKVYEVFHNVDN